MKILIIFLIVTLAPAAGLHKRGPAQAAMVCAGPVDPGPVSSPMASVFYLHDEEEQLFFLRGVVAEWKVRLGLGGWNIRVRVAPLSSFEDGVVGTSEWPNSFLVSKSATVTIPLAADHLPWCHCDPREYQRDTVIHELVHIAVARVSNETLVENLTTLLMKVPN